MDQHHDLSKSGSIFCVPDNLRDLGLSLIAPINTQALSEEETEWWWSFARSQDYMFSDFERGNREGWIARFRDMRHLHLDIGGDGYAILVNAWCCDTPELHFCIWNAQRPFSLTLAAGTELLDFVFEKMGATRVTGSIPVHNRLATKFATMLGFKYEGTLRKAFRFEGQALDVSVFGLLKEEWSTRQERLSNGRLQYQSN